VIRPSISKPQRFKIIILFLGIFSVWAVQTKTQLISWNESSRLAAVQALVERQSWQIDDLPLGGHTGDKIFFKGQFYSSKLPLLTVITTVPYQVLHRIFGSSLKLEACDEKEVCAYYWLSLIVIGLSSATLVVLFYQAIQHFNLPATISLSITLLFGFGSMMWPYSLVYNNHVPTALCLFASFLILLQNHPIDGSDRITNSRTALFSSGLLASVAVSFELTAIFLALGLAVLALVHYRSQIMWFVLGGVIPLAVTLLLDYQMLGQILPPYFIAEGYDYPGAPFSANVGGSRSANSIFSYTFRSIISDKGLLAYCPLLLWGFVGLGRAIQQKSLGIRREGIILLVAMLLQFIFIYTRTNNFGGKAYGARYFIILLPFLFYFLIFSLPINLRPGRANLNLFLLVTAASLSIFSAYQGVQDTWSRVKPPLYVDKTTQAPYINLCTNYQNGTCLGEFEFPCSPLNVGIRRRQFDIPEMQHPLQANFSNQITLLGYDLPSRHLKLDETIPLTLYWQAQTDLSQDYLQYNHLLNQEQEKMAGVDRPLQKDYPTQCWHQDEVLIDHLPLTLDNTLSHGIYQLHIGLYPDRDGGYTLPLKRVEAGQFLDLTSITVGPLKVGGPPEGATIVQVEPQHEQTMDFGNTIRLRGYDLEQHPQSITLQLYWESISVSETDFSVFVHLKDIEGNLVAQTDRPPIFGRYPTSLWEPPEIIADPLTIPLPVEILPGDYDLAIGLYNPRTGVRLPVSQTTDNSLHLARLQIL
jgi:hypothetical protein